MSKKSKKTSNTNPSITKIDTQAEAQNGASVGFDTESQEGSTTENTEDTENDTNDGTDDKPNEEQGDKQASPIEPQGEPSKEQSALIKEYRKLYPQCRCFYLTSDNQVFLADAKSYAELHQRSLKGYGKLQTIKTK